MADSATLIQHMNDTLLDIYDTIEEKGGTSPEEKNLDNVVKAVETITGGGGYTPPYDIPEFDGGEWGAIAYLEDGEVKYYSFTAEDSPTLASNVDATSRDIEVITVSGKPIYRSQVLAFAIGDNTNLTGGYSLAYFSRLQAIYGWEKYSKTSVGEYFALQCLVLNSPITIPSNVRTVGGYFLNDCYGFNSEVSFSEGVTTIGTYFLQHCYSFNSRISFPSTLSSVGNNFLYYCYVFNQPLDLSQTKIIGIQSYFAAHCYNFNSKVSFPSGLTTIAGSFLFSCRNFNQPLTFPESLRGVDSSFLASCHSFDHPLAFPIGVTGVGSNFLSRCYAFNNSLTFESSTLSANYGFLSGCTSFNQPIQDIMDKLASIPGYNSATATTGNSDYGFLAYCRSFNQPIHIEGKDVGTNAFAYCTNLNSPVTIGNGVRLGYSFMEHCETFNQPLEIPDDFTSSGQFMYHCYAFNQPLYIPANANLGNTAFYHCDALNSPVTFESGRTSLPSQFMSYCVSFNQPFELPDTITNIGTYFMGYWRAFDQPFELPPLVTAIPGFFRQYNDMLTSFTIPERITSIGEYFLWNCQNLGEVDIQTTAAPTNSNYTLANNIGENVPVYTKGVLLKGPGAQTWRNTLADSSNSSYRRHLYLEDTPLYLIYYDADNAEWWVHNETTFRNTWCDRGISGVVEAHYQPAVATLTNITGLPITTSYSSTSNYFMSSASKTLEKISGLQYFENVTTLRNYALYNCLALRDIGELPPNLETIGTDVLSLSTSFAEPLAIPSSVTSVGSYFMYRCDSFTGPLTIETTSAPNNSNYTLSTTSIDAPMYTEGIVLNGPGAQTWKDILVDRDSSPYRKLLLAPEPTLTNLKKAVNDGTAAKFFPVGTEFPDTWNGEDNPLIVAQYLDDSNNSQYGGAEGVLMVRRNIGRTSYTAFGTSLTDVNYTTSVLKKYLDGEYFDRTSDEAKAVVSEITIPYYNGRSVIGVPSKWFAMGGQELYGMYPLNKTEGFVWDYWKQKTGLSEDSWAANPGRVVLDTSGGACYFWLRTWVSTITAGMVYTTGYVGDNRVENTIDVYPACFIGKD